MASNEKQFPEKQELTIKFGKGLLGSHFTSKSGTEMINVKIPNRDPADKSRWESFAIPASFVHDNKFTNGVWMKLPEEGSTKVSRSTPNGKDDMGRTIWANETRTVTNRELKSMMEAYKEQSRESVLGNLESKRAESKATAHHTQKPKRDFSR